ncbi:hypothetical protein HL658_28090 [Azospirillum sp. RWY-5-1]|uniref:PAS domain-containing protein n=1 Tax=Azospirillum oleiclasticum TaxID=2735135 RepID=A0ABX2THY3_9PROT|nr:hypothetical protein [Azospirillum oleiclasticum]NYZ16421.1 hypothetical protein [Azospirillum oleiclasticum]NYZ23863.1 hypothetical protein [Azospirillum oleiclasticum]
MAFFDRLWTSTWHSLSLDAVEPADAGRLLLVWKRAVREAPSGLPLVAALSLQDSPGLLTNVALVDLSGGVDTASYRYVGPRLTRLYRKAEKGRRLKDIYDRKVFAEIVSAFTIVLRTREPLFTWRNFTFLNHDLGYRRLILPCAAGPAGGVALIVCIHPSRADLTEESQWAEAADRYRAVVMADA